MIWEVIKRNVRGNEEEKDPVMNPHARKGNRHLSHWINSKKREWRGGENCLNNELPLQTMINFHAQSTLKNASNAEYMEFQHAYMQKPSTSMEC